MKKINVIVPCYNEENSIKKFYDIIKGMFNNEIKHYDYDIIFVDDRSKDNTRNIIREICEKDKKHVKAVFNVTNFWFSRNVFSSLLYSDWDAAFLVNWDLQDPPQLLPKFIHEREAWYKVVVWEKTGWKESKIMNFCRNTYYYLIRLFSESPQLKHFTDFWLYDKSFIDILRQVDDMQPYLKQIVPEYAENYKTVSYEQNKSNRWNSNYNFYRNYDFAMEWITSSTKKLMRISIFLWSIMMLLSFLYWIFVFIKKIIYWDSYPMWIAWLTVWLFLIWSLLLFFIWVLWEYVLSINTKTLRRPRVVVWEKINFD